MKECNLDMCVGYHEGYCVIKEIYDLDDSFQCTAKSNDDLLTYDEIVELSR